MTKISSRRWFERVVQELENGRIEERPLKDASGKYYYLHGHIEENGKITVNPIVNTVDTLIHELLHRLYPHWPESYVKAKTSEVMRTTTAEEQKALFERYQQKVKKVKKVKVVK